MRYVPDQPEVILRIDDWIDAHHDSALSRGTSLYRGERELLPFVTGLEH